MSSKYDDIINLPHHQSDKHPHMTMKQRAAQFAPFAALAGYAESIGEAHRQTDEFAALDATVIEEADRTLQELAAYIDRGESPTATCTYFEPDTRKAGGAYRTEAIQIKKIDRYTSELILADGSKLPIQNIIEIAPSQETL